MKVFVDEQAWLALVDSRHPFHTQFKNEFGDFLKGTYKFYSTNVIIGSVVSKIKHTFGAADAIKFYNIIEEAWLGNHLNILWIGRRTMKDALKIFKKFTHSNLGLFDAANIVFMNRRNIRFILTDNKFYSEMGFKVIPESLE
jgi:predicted nucleic acid-binding protein